MRGISRLLSTIKTSEKQMFVGSAGIGQRVSQMKPRYLKGEKCQTARAKEQVLNPLCVPSSNRGASM